MINKQIYNWITTNSLVYTQNTLLHHTKLAQQNKKFEQLAQDIIKTLGKCMIQELKQKKQILIQNIFVLKVQSTAKHQFHPTLRLHGKLANLIPHHQNHFQPILYQIINNDSLNQAIASLLFQKQEIIKGFIQIFARAIHDLILLGNTLQIDFYNFQLKLNRKFLKCEFKHHFLNFLNKKQKIQNFTKSFTCNHRKNKENLGAIEKQNEFYDQKWSSIKFGNLMKLPYLIDIKEHFNKGMKLYYKNSQLPQP